MTVVVVMLAIPVAAFAFCFLWVMSYVVLTGGSDKGASVARHLDAEPGKACGRIGNLTIKFNTADLFFPVTYEGVSYWGGEGYLNKTKWCDDRIRSVAFPVDWTGLKPSRNGTYFTSRNPAHILIEIVNNYSPDPAESMQSILVGWARDEWNIPDVQNGYDQIKAISNKPNKFGLYAINIPTDSANVTRTAFWAEDESQKISVLISCRKYLKSDSTSCTQQVADTKRQIWIKNRYRIEWLPQWNAMHESSLAFVDERTISRVEQ